MGLSVQVLKKEPPSGSQKFRGLGPSSPLTSLVTWDRSLSQVPEFPPYHNSSDNDYSEGDCRNQHEILFVTLFHEEQIFSLRKQPVY